MRETTDHSMVQSVEGCKNLRRSTSSTETFGTKPFPPRDQAMLHLHAGVGTLEGLLEALEEAADEDSTFQRVYDVISEGLGHIGVGIDHLVEVLYEQA